MIDYTKLIDEIGSYDPIIIGFEILRRAGYKVEKAGYGYNSLVLRVYDSEDNLLYCESIGD